MDEYATEELEEANAALSDATQLRDVGGRDEAIVNRLYYACYHAAKGVLYAKGFEPTTTKESSHYLEKKSYWRVKRRKMPDGF